jgi:hypothetical protein
LECLRISAFPFESTIFLDFDNSITAVFEDHCPYIHSQNDVLQNLDLDRGLEFAKMALGYIAEVAGGSLDPSHN